MSRLNTIIDANIKENGNQEITGKALNYVLNEIAKEVEQGGNVKADGVYPDLIAGDLAGHGESVPAEFTFRASGGKSIKDGKAYIKRIKGNSVVWNNMVDSRGYDGGFFVDVPPPIIQGHKYLLKRTHATDSLYLIPVINGEEKYEMNLRNGVYAGIFESPHTGDITRVYSERYSGACVISDLTKMYGAGNEPTTIEEFNARKPIVADEYAYNEGQVIHCNTESIKSVGDNAWDEQWESGHIDYNTGVNTPDSGRLRTKGYIRVLPNEEYHLSLPTASHSSDLVVICYDENKAFIQHIGGGSANKTFRIPTNCHYIRFTWDGTQYANNIMLSLVHSGWKQDTDAGYQPYWQDTLPLPIIRKYFPDGMKKAGTAHDEIRFNKASGKWEKVVRIGSVDLGEIDIRYDAERTAFYYRLRDSKTKGQAICSQFTLNNVSAVAIVDGEMSLHNTYYDNGVIFKASAYTDAASFKAAMQGVILYYELAEPIVTEITEDFRDYYNVADFGTEQAISNIPSAPFSADIIYQFNAVDMIREHELEITQLQTMIATMQAQLASLTKN